MDAKIDAILHYLGDWIDDHFGQYVEDSADDLTNMIKKIEMEDKTKLELYPLTIIKDRYNGVYSGGKWLAFCNDPDEINTDIWGSDTACDFFWWEYKNGNINMVIGIGDTISDAVEDLRINLNNYDKSVWYEAMEV